MKGTLLLTSVLLALTASLALAEGVDIAWGTACWTEGNQNSETTFACNTNGTAGTRAITVSWMVDTPIPDLVGVEWEIRGYHRAVTGNLTRWWYYAGPLPDYWKLGVAPDCRAGKATFNSNLTGSETENLLCVDWSGGQAFNAPNYTWSDDVVKITLGYAISASYPYEALANQVYYGGQVTFVNSKAVGTGSCEGCSCEMVFELYRLTAAGLGGSRDDIEVRLNNTALVWNAWGDCTTTPTRGTTWGQVKSLYR